MSEQKKYFILSPSISNFKNDFLNFAIKRGRELDLLDDQSSVVTLYCCLRCCYLVCCYSLGCCFVVT